MMRQRSRGNTAQPGWYAHLRLQAEVDRIWTALASATSVNAELIGRPDLGQVAEGCTADLLILAGNICDDPSVVWSPDSQRTIVQDGRVITNSKTASLTDARRPADRCGCGLKFRLPGDRTDQVVLRLLRHVRRIDGLRVPEHRLAGRIFPPEAAVTTG